MFFINDDLSIHITRGDVAFFQLTAANENGETYKFQAGDVVRVKVFDKKACENVAFQKDIGIEEEADYVDILLTENETKIGEVISKPTDYWYEVELNPYTNPQTIIGYDDDGPKLFKLFPEGADVPDMPIEPEDIPVVDTELDLTSERPVQNRAIARAYVVLKEEMGNRMDYVERLANVASIGKDYQLLWENPDPSAEFPATNVELGKETMSIYSDFLITYKSSKLASRDEDYIFLKNSHEHEGEFNTGTPGGYANSQMMTFVWINGKQTHFSRTVETYANVYVMFRDCTGNLEDGASEILNGTLIPCKIYGVVKKGYIDQDVKGLEESVAGLQKAAEDI